MPYMSLHRTEYDLLVTMTMTPLTDILIDVDKNVTVAEFVAR